MTVSVATKEVAAAAVTTAVLVPPKPKLLRRVVLAIGGFISKRLLSLCWVTYVLGLVWVLLHPAVTVSTGEAKPRGTYISENALLIDSFDPSTSHDETHAALAYQRALTALPGVGATGCHDDCVTVVDWLDAQLATLDRVESYRQTFWSAADANLTTRTNVYGILRAAPLADSKESLVLVTHYRNAGTANGEYSGVALALALLEYLVDAKWLAKDVIVLFADDGPLDGADGFAAGTEAWLEAYHSDPLSTTTDSTTYDELPMRAGVIRAAVNVETLGRSWDATCIAVLTAGMNGQLPNLDLVNAAVLALHGEHIPVVLNRRNELNGVARLHARLEQAVSEFVPLEFRAAVRAYLTNLFGLFEFMRALAVGPSGAHAHFVRYNIDSITLSTQHANHFGTLSVRATLRSIEKLVRALSNVEEKLHQSFFLYVLPNTEHFVSVGEYYYAVALSVAPAIAHMTALASRTIGMRLAFSLLALFVVQLLAVAALVAAPAALATTAGSAWRFVLLLTIGQLGVVLGVLPLLYKQPAVSGCAERRDWRVRVRAYEEAHKDDDKRAAAGDATFIPRARRMSIYDILASIPEQDSGWRGLKFVVMVLIVFAHCVLGIINYPMALFCAVPMALFALVEPYGNKQSAAKQVRSALWLLASSPLALFALGYALDRDGFLTSLAYMAESFAQRLNLLALPYLCCLYVPVHTLSVAIFLFPITESSDDDVAAATAMLLKKTN